jgi:hypothetical protein
VERIGSPTIAHVVTNGILRVLETWLCNFHCCVFHFYQVDVRTGALHRRNEEV